VTALTILLPINSMLKRLHTAGVYLILSSWGFVSLLPTPIAAQSLSLPPIYTPAKGMLLIATDKIAGSIFQQSVILLTNYNQQGARGLILNKPTTIDVPMQLTQDQFTSYQFHIGGPVVLHAVFALIHSQKQPSLANKIAANIFLVTGKTHIHLAQKQVNNNAEFIYFSGYSGWAAKQLDNEIALGHWLVTPVDDLLLFNKSARELWPSLYKMWSGLWI